MPQDQAILTKSFSNGLYRVFSLLGRKTEPEMVTEWVKYILGKGITREQFAAACEATLESPPADVYRFTIINFLAAILPAKKSMEDTAVEKWERVLSYVRSGGSSRGFPADWEEREIRAVQSIGGLNLIGDTKETDLSYLRHSFVETYKAFSRIYAADEKQLKLEGAVGNSIKQLCRSTDL